MLKTNAVLARKNCNYKTEECVIEKVISLGGEKYDHFTNHLHHDYDFIRDNIDLMYYSANDRVQHCVLVVGEGREDGVLIQSDGAVYARYTALIPHAATLLQAQDTNSNRKAELLDKTLTVLGNMFERRELYEVLSDDVGMSNEEITANGFELSDFFQEEEEENPVHSMSI